MRYEDGNENLTEVFLKVLEDRFPQWQGLNFKLVFDTKKKISKGKICLASVEVANEKIRYLSKDKIAIEGYDYVLIVDAKVWELADNVNKERIISHELQHVFVDERGACKVLPHEIEDFYAEVELNKDDPEWRINLAQLLDAIYEQEKEMRKAV